MLLGRTIGTAVATLKHPSLSGCKLLVVQPLMADGESPDGDPLVVVDCVGAGLGERVVLTSDGAWSREALHRQNTPVRWTAIGIQDPPHHMRPGNGDPAGSAPPA
jgi:ethanolamine utilization protein EutN